MGQTWSKFVPGHTEAGNTPPEPEMDVCTSQDPNLQHSEASTASSSAPFYQGGPFSVAAADVELSSLKDDESDDERRKESQGIPTPTPTPSTSQQVSSFQAFVKGPEKLYLKKSQASPSTAGTRGLLRTFNRKAQAFKQPRNSSPRLLQNHTSEPAKRNRAHQQESSTSSPTHFAPDEDAVHLAQMDDEDTPSQSVMLPEPVGDDVKMESAKESEELMQPSSQKPTSVELDRKRKAPAGLPSLAVECMGASRMKLKARTSLEKSSEGGSRKAALDLGEAAVGRQVRKRCGSRSIFEGQVASYDVSSRLYQIECDNGKEEAMAWPDLEPCLVDQSKTSSVKVEEIKGTTILRKSLRNAPRAKKIEEFVYTKSKVRRRRQKK